MTHRMDVKQVLILVLLLVPACTSKMYRCYDSHELSDAAERKLNSRYQQHAHASRSAVARDSPASCPVALYQQRPAEELSGRSLSPWRYVLVTIKDHFPSPYAEAQCLCSGCIVFQGNGSLPVESHDYNSVPVKQSRVFLKRELCSDGKKYYLMPVSLEVVVGCTCARPNVSS